jgi:hypothetical protein
MKRHSGVAFLSVLFLTLIVLMSVAVTVKRTLQGSQFQVQDQHSVAAFYAADSGVAEALSRWQDNKNWAPALYTGTLNNGNSRFEIRFGAAHSVNNLEGDAPRSSYRGAGSVPPYQALLVVTGFAGSRTRVLEVMVARGGLFPPGAALMTQERLTMQGDVTVTAVRSLADNAPQAADVSILNDADTSNHASWDGNGAINVDGAFNSNSDNAGAIPANIAAANVSAVRRSQHNAPPRNLRIADRVSEALSAGYPQPALTGPSTTLAPGNYTLSNPGMYNGDLVLNGCNLYVSGDFRLNGSVRGNGSVFVTGATEMKGSAVITGQDNAGVALYSAGDVTLRGFNGSQFLSSFMAGAGADENGVTYSEHLNNFRTYSSRMLQAVADGMSAPSLLGNYSRFGNTPGVQSGSMSDFDAWYAPLIADIGWDNYNNTGVPAIRTNPTRRLTVALENGAASPSRDFLLKKFRELRPMPTDVTTIQTQVMHPSASQGLLGSRPVSSGIGGVDLNQIDGFVDALRAGADNGLFDILNDAVNNTTLVPTWERQQLYHRALSTFREMDFDRPGMAFFQGIVYTEGNFLAEDELRIVGAMYAVGPHSRVTLRNGIRVTFVPELVARAGQALGTVHVRQWLRR